MTTKPPRSANDETSEMRYFPRMLDKIRLHAKGELRPDFHENLGKGMDARCCDFLQVAYTSLKRLVLASRMDEEILEWCYTNGRRLSEGIFSCGMGSLPKLVGTTSPQIVSSS